MFRDAFAALSNVTLSVAGSRIDAEGSSAASAGGCWVGDKGSATHLLFNTSESTLAAGATTFTPTSCSAIGALAFVGDSLPLHFSNLITVSNVSIFSQACQLGSHTSNQYCALLGLLTVDVYHPHTTRVNTFRTEVSDCIISFRPSPRARLYVTVPRAVTTVLGTVTYSERGEASVTVEHCVHTATNTTVRATKAGTTALSVLSISIFEPFPVAVLTNITLIALNCTFAISAQFASVCVGVTAYSWISMSTATVNASYSSSMISFKAQDSRIELTASDGCAVSVGMLAAPNAIIYDQSLVAMERTSIELTNVTVVAQSMLGGQAVAGGIGIAETASSVSIVDTQFVVTASNIGSFAEGIASAAGICVHTASTEPTQRCPSAESLWRQTC